MIEFLKQLPHLEPYGTPVYFIYLIGALLPIFVGLFFKKRFPVYELGQSRIYCSNADRDGFETNLCGSFLPLLANPLGLLL